MVIIGGNLLDTSNRKSPIVSLKRSYKNVSVIRSSPFHGSAIKATSNSDGFKTDYFKEKINLGYSTNEISISAKLMLNVLIPHKLKYPINIQKENFLVFLIDLSDTATCRCDITKREHKILL